MKNLRQDCTKRRKFIHAAGCIISDKARHEAVFADFALRILLTLRPAASMMETDQKDSVFRFRMHYPEYFRKSGFSPGFSVRTGNDQVSIENASLRKL